MNVPRHIGERKIRFWEKTFPHADLAVIASLYYEGGHFPIAYLAQRAGNKESAEKLVKRMRASGFLIVNNGREHFLTLTPAGKAWSREILHHNNYNLAGQAPPYDPWRM